MSKHIVRTQRWTQDDAKLRNRAPWTTRSIAAKPRMTFQRNGSRGKPPKGWPPLPGQKAFYWQRVNRARSFSQSRMAWSSRYLPGSFRTHLHGPMVAVMIL
jgi:hypothetical protein